jgi:hypothetical protein
VGLVVVAVAGGCVFGTGWGTGTGPGSDDAIVVVAVVVVDTVASVAWYVRSIVTIA